MSRHRQSWKYQGDPYHWRSERDAVGDTNWRGTRILEVIDMFEVEWQNERVCDGRRRVDMFIEKSSSVRA